MKAKSKTKIIAVVNQKGGVGKSTVAFHLAHAGLTEKKNARVLCLDLDGQGNLSQYLTGDLDIIKDTQGGVGLFLEGREFEPTKTSFQGLELLHGHEELDRYDKDTEIEDRVYDSEMANTLRNLGYDYVIIDTPPAVGVRQLGALCWADVAIIPMDPVMVAIVGMQNVVAAIDTKISAINPQVRWFAMMNRANLRAKSHREKDEWVREHYGSRVLATMASRTSVSDAMEEMPAQPVWSRKGAPKVVREEWLNICKEIVSK